MPRPRPKTIEPGNPLPEYPTPQFVRDSYLSLNGPWELGIDKGGDGPVDYAYSIIVPFAVETIASGVHRRLEPGEALHYRKRFTLPKGFRKERVLLHFEGVDQICDVYLNGVHVTHHEGGYTPFTLDCLELVEGENELRVDVTDDTSSPVYPRGKQKEKPGGIWYTPTSGIWQSVWLESVPNQVIQALEITPLYDEKKVRVRVQYEGRIHESKVEVSLFGHPLAAASLDENASTTISLSSDFRSWSPESPVLYDLKVTIDSDEVTSYFAMRKFSTIEHDGHLVFALNNKPYFLTGVLDQGYYEDSGLTQPSDQAIQNDLRMLKDMGFNMVRKHIKIEPMRWYYHCDRLGLIVIQDLVSSGEEIKPFLFITAPFFRWKIDDTKQYSLLGRDNQRGRQFFEEEMERVVTRLRNVPSIAAWTLFNEGWGQFDSVRLCKALKEMDPQRLVDATSGWFDTGCGDFNSRHIYMTKIRIKDDGRRVMSLSEFGAYSHVVPNHCKTTKKTFYRYFHTKEQLSKALFALYEKQVIPMVKRGLSVAVLTQLSDVEQETNGLVTYDRKVVKIDATKMKEINKRLTFEGGRND